MPGNTAIRAAREDNSRTMQWIERTSGDIVIFSPPDAVSDALVDRVADAADRALARITAWLPEFSDRKLYLYLTNSSVEELPRGWVDKCREPADKSLLLWMDVREGMSLDGFSGRLLWTAARFSGVDHDRQQVIGALRRYLERVAGGTDRFEDVQQRAARRLRRSGAVRPFEAVPDSGLLDLAFLGYVHETFGARAFDRFVQVLLVEGPGRAAEQALSCSLGDLTGEWKRTLHERTQSPMRNVLGQSLSLLSSHASYVMLFIGLMSIDVAFAISIPLSIMVLFDGIISTGRFNLVPVWALIVLVVFLVGSFDRYQRSVLAGLIQELVHRDLLRASFEHIQSLPLRFFSTSRAGDLLSNVTADTHRAGAVTGRILPELCFEIMSLSVGAAVLFSLSWAMGLAILLVGAPLAALAAAKVGRDLERAEGTLQSQNRSMRSYIRKNLTAQVVVKSFSLEQGAMLGFESILERLFGLRMKVNRATIRLTGASGAILLALRLTLLALGALLISRSALSVGALIATVALAGPFLASVASIVGLFTQMRGAAGAFDRIRNLLREPSGQNDIEDPVHLEPLASAIVLEAVHLRDDAGRPLLRDLSMRIEAGSRVAIVGPSGGARALAGLLPRLTDPNRGRILLDGTDIKLATLSSLRSQIGLVPRDAVLFDMSIADNIAVGREGAKDRSVHAAATLAGLDPAVSKLESGYETIVGDGGMRLSRELRRRIGIARALVRDPRILILDDATASLDAAAEADVLRTLEKAARGRTIILITHRLTAAATCEDIFVIENGRLVEQGSPAQLLAAGGPYWKLWREQGGPERMAGLPAMPAPRGVESGPIPVAA